MVMLKNEINNNNYNQVSVQCGPHYVRRELIKWKANGFVIKYNLCIYKLC
jgi:hypothetical protein